MGLVSLTMCSLLLILAAFLNVRAIDEQEQSGPQTSILRTTRNAASLSDCATGVQSGRCFGSDFFCRYDSSQGVCMNDTCRCPEVPNRDACTCLPRIGDCHIEQSSDSPNGYSCLVPDNLNANYDVHIISVYEASSNHFFRYHPTGTSNVRLFVSGKVVKPIVLVLASYEPIEWRLSIPTGVEIERVLLSSYYLNDSRVVQLGRIKTIEKVSRHEFPYGYGEDSGGGGDTVKLLESTVARFGPIASFRGTYQSNRWTLPIIQQNHSYLPVCGYPSLPVDGTAALSKTPRGVEVEYSCFTGQTLKGAQSALCLQDGTWSAPPPTCSSTGDQTSNTAGTSTIAISVTVTVMVIVCILVILLVSVFCICHKRHVSSQSLARERYSTRPSATLQNSYHQRGVALSAPGNTSEGTNCQTVHLAETPCPAYAAQDLPPDYNVVSKDNPPDYHTLNPATQFQLH